MEKAIKTRPIYTLGEELFNSINEKTATIKELREEISNVKNKKYCNYCGSFVANDSSFCKNCGNKF